MLLEFLWLWHFQVTYYTDATRTEVAMDYASGQVFQTREQCMDARMRATNIKPPGVNAVKATPYTFHSRNNCTKISATTRERVEDPLNSEVGEPGPLRAFGAGYPLPDEE